MMGVIQEKYTLADVICQHKIDGSIIPLGSIPKFV